MPKSEMFERNAVKAVDLIDEIPNGQCVTYGDLAEVLGIFPRYAALIMATAPEIHAVAWHRVVGSGGVVRPGPQKTEQIRRLRAEGVQIDGDRVLAFARRHYQFG